MKHYNPEKQLEVDLKKLGIGVEKQRKANTGIVRDIKHKYYYCSKCSVCWHTLEPYETIHFKDEQTDLWNYRQLPLKDKKTHRHIMPACPNCLKRDNVKAVRSKKRKNK